MGTTRSQTASATIPTLWRFLLIYVEPFCAVFGAFALQFYPALYTAAMTRQKLTAIDPASEFIYTELLGGWLYFAFTEAVVLRFVDDYRVWRLLCVGMLLSDAAYVHSCAQGVGGWSEWVQVGGWTIEEWAVTLSTWPFLIARLAIASGVGMRAKVE